MELHGSKWRIKKRVPLDLRKQHPHHYPSPFKYAYLAEPDKTKASAKGWAWLADIEQEFQRVRETGSPYKLNLPEDDAELIIRKVIHSRLNADEEIRASGILGDDVMLAQMETIQAESKDQEQLVISRGVLPQSAIDIAQEWLFAHGYDFPADSPEFRQFALRLFRRMSEASRITESRSKGDWIDTPPVPEKESAQKVPLLSEVIEHFIGKQRDDVPMFKKYRPALGLFLECVGDKAVSQLKQKEIDEYFDLLCKLPPRWLDEKRKTGLPVGELVKLEWPKCISKKTFEDGYMAAFRPFLQDTVRVFQDQGFPPHLTIVGIKYSGKREETENEQRAMRRDELERLFCGTEYQTFALDPDSKHCYWLPLIGLYTGARVNEVCQLNPQCDIRQEEGVWVFDINEKSEGDERVKKSVKNISSRRKVPIHSELIRLGVLRYVESVKNAGAKLLFPQWNPSSAGKASGTAERWFRGLIRDSGLRDETPKLRLVGFHAFRHTFLNNAMNNDVQFAEWLTGHAPEGVSKIVTKYQGEAEITKKAQIMESIRFDLSPPVPVWWADGESHATIPNE
jgi:integrase